MFLCDSDAVVYEVYKRLFPLHTLSSINEAAEEAAAATAGASAMVVETWWNNVSGE